MGLQQSRQHASQQSGPLGIECQPSVILPHVWQCPKRVRARWRTRSNMETSRAIWQNRLHRSGTAPGCLGELGGAFIAHLSIDAMLQVLPVALAQRFSKGKR